MAISNTEPIPELYASSQSVQQLIEQTSDLVRCELTPRQICDLELLMNGGFYPLQGFLSHQDYDSVVENMCLGDGTLWPIPIILDVAKVFADRIELGQTIALEDREGVVLATLTVTDKWVPDKGREALSVLGTKDDSHPEVHNLYNRTGTVYLGGPIVGLQAPRHYAFETWRETPNELRDKFRSQSWHQVVGLQMRSPVHRVHKEMVVRAERMLGAKVLIHPVVGELESSLVDPYTRMRCYSAVLDQFSKATTHFSLLNLTMRMAGPREALWHGLVRKNHGCTHFIVGCDHASPGRFGEEQEFYPPYAAQELFREHEEAMGIKLVAFKELAYIEQRAQFEVIDEIADEESIITMNLSESALKRHLREGRDIPDWFTFPEVINELRHAIPERELQGFSVLFTGYSGSGKSTLANALMIKLLEFGGRPVTLLDGDIVRKNLSSELGFSKEHRNLNVQRIGFVAAEITKNGGIAICAPIAPYASVRRQVREMIEQHGTFVEIHVATSIQECERRDRKGLYQRARQGKVKGFTGISDPYDIPEYPEVRIQTEGYDVEYCTQQILQQLKRMSLIK